MDQVGPALDQYARRARLYPALLVGLPVPITLVAVLPALGASLAGLWALASWCGMTFLLAQLGRDLGKRKEKGLFDSWGGPPTTVRLRQLTTENPDLIARIEDFLGRYGLFAVVATGHDDARDDGWADQTVDRAILVLREATRDRSKFPLVFEENCNYGFRRNLWGLKPLALFLNLAGLVVLSAVLAEGLLENGTAPAGMWAAAATTVVLLLMWILKVTPRWVKVAAQEYAERLLGAAVVLGGVGHS